MQVRIRRLVILRVLQPSRKESLLGVSGPQFWGKQIRATCSGLHVEDREGGCPRGFPGEHAEWGTVFTRW